MKRAPLSHPNLSPRDMKRVRDALTALDHGSWDDFCCTESYANKRITDAPSANVLIPLITRFVDQESAALYHEQPQETDMRDRLFECLMTRFDVMNTHRRAHIKLSKICRKNPDISWLMTKALWASMRNTLELVQIQSPSPLQLTFLFTAYLYVFMAWRADASNAPASTMKAIDKALDRGRKLGVL